MVNQQRIIRKSKVRWKSAAARRLIALAGDDKNVEQAVESVVLGLLERVNCPPTDLIALQSCLGVNEIEIGDFPFSAELRRNAGGFKIMLSEHLSSARRRFTIAHELAHIALERSGPRCPHTGSELERICDMLATEILMPRRIFEATLKPVIRIEEVLRLARRFDTSLSSTAIRIAELTNRTVFEVKGDAVVWGYGVVRRGPIRFLQPDLIHVLHNARAKPKGEDVIYIMGRRRGENWQIGWITIGANKRQLFIMERVGNVSAGGGSGRPEHYSAESYLPLNSSAEVKSVTPKPTEVPANSQRDFGHVAKAQ